MRKLSLQQAVKSIDKVFFISLRHPEFKLNCKIVYVFVTFIGFSNTRFAGVFLIFVIST